MANDLVLFHVPQTRSMIVQWVLEEIGQPYDVRLLDMRKGENKDPAYLAINPMGKVPALRHKGVVITEAAAICAYLADAFPEAKLAPPIGDARRGPYLKWMFFGPTCLELVIIDRTFKREGGQPATLSYGTVDATVDLVAKAVAKGPWILGTEFTAADIIIGANLQWGTATEVLPKRPEFVDYMTRLAERPAYKRISA